MKQYKVINNKGYGTLKVDKGKGRGDVFIEPSECIVTGVLPSEKDLFTIEEVKEPIVTAKNKK
jgi:hypothetical protein